VGLSIERGPQAAPRERAGGHRESVHRRSRQST
jgi:hypothetical protein